MNYVQEDVMCDVYILFGFFVKIRYCLNDDKDPEIIAFYRGFFSLFTNSFLWLYNSFKMKNFTIRFAYDSLIYEAQVSEISENEFHIFPKNKFIADRFGIYPL